MTGAAAAARNQKHHPGRRPLRRPDPPQAVARRSLRPRRGRLPISVEDYEGLSFSSSSDDEDERGRKKVKQAGELPRSSAASEEQRPCSYSSSDSACSTSSSSDEVKHLKKRRRRRSSDGSVQLVERTGNVPPRSKVSAAASPRCLQKGIPLPERTVLESVLERLQRKDTYSVFAEPVDPEELPDYHEVIEHPMDFGTIRKKLARKAYRTFEQFEDDVFLICSNAMQYNAPDTVYFRQARAIECMARKKFQILRSDNIYAETQRKSEKKIKSNSMDNKPIKKYLCIAEKDPLCSDISSSATHASALDTSTGFSTVEANVVDQIATADGLITRQVKSIDKTESADKLSVSGLKTMEKHASLNGLSTAQANAVMKPVTTNGLSSTQANGVGKPTTANGLSTPPADGVEKPATANRLNTRGANGVEKPATANGFTTQANYVEKPATVNGLNTVEVDSVDKSTSDGIIECNFSHVESKSEKGESRSEKADESPAKCSPSKFILKPFLLDENRRATYNMSDPHAVVVLDSAFGVFESKMKQLVAVGPHTEYSYARSLARFAASLGPTGWEIASKRIEKALPSSVKFGPGWVGEYEPLPTPILMFENQNQKLRYDMDLPCKVESAKDKDNGELSKITQNRDSQDMQLGLENPIFREMRLRTSNPGKGTIVEEQKENRSGVSAENQTQISHPMLKQKKDQVGVDTITCSNTVLEQLDVSNSPSVNSISIEKSLGRSVFHIEAHKSVFGVSSETLPIVTDARLQHHKDQVATDFSNDCKNFSKKPRVFSSSISTPVEIALQNPEFHIGANKQKLFGVSAETQPRVSDMILQQQKNHVTIDFTKACNDISKPIGLCKSASASSTPVETTSLRSESQSQACKKGFGISAEIQPRVIGMMLQKQNDQLTIDFGKAYNILDQVGVPSSSHIGSFPVETVSQRSECQSEVAISRSLGMIPTTKSQVQLESQKQPEPVNLPSTTNALGLTVGGSSNNKAAGIFDNDRAKSSLKFFSNHQPGVVGYSVAQGGHEEFIDFKLMGLSKKVSNQTDNLNADIYTARHFMPSSTYVRIDDPYATKAAAAVGTWTFSGDSAGYRPVDGVLHPNSQIGYARRTPTVVSRIPGDSMIRPLPQVFPHPIHRVPEESQLQNRGMAFFPQLVAADVTRYHGRTPWHGLVPHSQTRQKDMLPPDLNIGFPSPGSPVRPSGIHVDSQHPDLALQL